MGTTITFNMIESRVVYCDISYITEMIITNSAIGKFMPENIVDVYADIYLHGILKPES